MVGYKDLIMIKAVNEPLYDVKEKQREVMARIRQVVMSDQIIFKSVDELPNKGIFYIAENYELHIEAGTLVSTGKKGMVYKMFGNDSDHLAESILNEVIGR